MELLRRVFLISSSFAAIFFTFYADLSPVVIVSNVDFSDQQKREGSYMGIRLMTERTERLAGLRLHDYIAEATKGRLFNVDGRGWEPAVENAVAAEQSKPLAKDWQRRLPSDKHPMEIGRAHV
jgi:3-isopropylmalate dehydratase small subunit